MPSRANLKTTPRQTSLCEIMIRSGKGRGAVGSKLEPSKTRTAFALVAASLAGPFYFSGLLALGLGGPVLGFMAVGFVLAAMLSIPVTFVLGFALYLTLKRMGWLSFPVLTGSAAILGAAVWSYISGTSFEMDWFRVLSLVSFSFCGTVSAVTFWLIAQPQPSVTPKGMQGRVAITALSLVALFTFSLAAAARAGLGFLASQFPAGPATVMLGPHTFRVPPEHADFPIETDKPADRIYLIALWPTLEGRTEKNYATFSNPRGSHLRILIENAAGPEAIEFRLGLAKKVAVSWEQEQTGISLLKLNPVEPLRRAPDEIYVRGGSDTQMFITCSVDGSVPNPGCAHTFSADGILYRISYRKTLLENWSEIQDGVVNLVNSFRADGVNK